MTQKRKQAEGQLSFRPIIAGVAIGVLVELPALFFAVASAGAGHGDYVAARALFPIPMLVTLATGNSTGVVSIGLALVQFPIYGGIVGYTTRDQEPWPIFAILFSHLIATVACFSSLLLNFS